jgi:hypothetical protein
MGILTLAQFLHIATHANLIRQVSQSRRIFILENSTIEVSQIQNPYPRNVCTPASYSNYP